MLLKKENLGNQPNTADFAEAHAGILVSMELIHAGDVLGVSQNLLDLKNTADKNGQLSKFIIKHNEWRNGWKENMLFKTMFKNY